MRRYLLKNTCDSLVTPFASRRTNSGFERSDTSVEYFPLFPRFSGERINDGNMNAVIRRLRFEF